MVCLLLILLQMACFVSCVLKHSYMHKRGVPGSLFHCQKTGEVFFVQVHELHVMSTMQSPFSVLLLCLLLPQAQPHQLHNHTISSLAPTTPLT